MNEIYEEIQKNFSQDNKPVPLILLVYSYNFNDDNWSLINNINIKIINIEQLFDYKYDFNCIKNNDDNLCLYDKHPSAKAWEIIVPEFIKELRKKQ